MVEETKGLKLYWREHISSIFHRFKHGGRNRVWNLKLCFGSCCTSPSEQFIFLSQAEQLLMPAKTCTNGSECLAMEPLERFRVTWATGLLLGPSSSFSDKFYSGVSYRGDSLVYSVFTWGIKVGGKQGRKDRMKWSFEDISNFCVSRKKKIWFLTCCNMSKDTRWWVLT